MPAVRNKGRYCESPPGWLIEILWIPNDGHGCESANYKEWKLYSPIMTDVHFVLQNITRDKLERHERP